MRLSLAPALISAAAATHPLHIERARYLVDKIKENVVKATVHHGRAKVEGSIATVDNFSRYSNEEKISPGKKSKLIEGRRRDQIGLGDMDPSNMAMFLNCESFFHSTVMDAACKCDDSSDGVLSQTCTTP